MVRSSDDLPESLQPFYDDSEAEVHQEVKIVYDKIMAKTQPNRDVLYMYYFMGHNAKEISETLEVSHGVVRQTIHRFKKDVSQ